jgi:hypothetical protein
MKRSYLCMGLILTTAILASTSRTFGDSKTRKSFSGSGRTQSGIQNGKSSGTLSSRQGSLNHIHSNGNHGDSGNTESRQGNPGGTRLNAGFNPQNLGNKLKLSGKESNGAHSNPVTINQPLNARRKIGHLIKLPNGTKTPAVGINAAQFLKHKGTASLGHGQIQNILATAPKHLCSHPKFSWWINVCHHHCHANYGCWNVSQQYWDCWTPCHWHVVQYQQLSYFVGLNAIHIPEMQAYGVQDLVAGSPAQLSGLLPGDLIISVNGQPVSDPNLMNMELGRGRLDLQVIREGFATPIDMTVFPRMVQTMSF